VVAGGGFEPPTFGL